MKRSVEEAFPSSDSNELEHKSEVLSHCDKIQRYIDSMKETSKVGSGVTDKDNNE